VERNVKVDRLQEILEQLVQKVADAKQIQQQQIEASSADDENSGR
jgi:hypothetical protein